MRGGNADDLDFGRKEPGPHPDSSSFFAPYPERFALPLLHMIRAPCALA